MNYLNSSPAKSHWHRHCRLHALLLICLSMFAAIASGADDPLGDATPSILERGHELALRGSYIAAIDLFSLVDGIDKEEAAIAASRAHMLIGQHEQAMRVCEEAISDYASTPLLSTQLAEVKRATGQSAEALEILQAVMAGNSEPPVRTLVQYGSLLQLLGRKQESYTPLNAAAARYQTGMVFDSEEVGMVALAHWLLDQFHDANTLFSEAVRSNPQNLEAQVLWGDLFQDKFNNADAQISYNKVLEINRRYVPALTGMAQITDPERTLQRALEINSRYVPALEVYGILLMRNDKEEQAREFLDEALRNNPESIKALSTLAAQAALKEQMAEYARLEQLVNDFSPDNAAFYAEIADAFGNSYRFKEAVEYARKSIAADPRYWKGHTLLGSNLVRLGEEDEGKYHLELAFENDPFNVLTSNLLKVFDTLETYATLESEHFRVNMSHRDASILWPYLEPLLEESWDRLTARYGYEPEVPVILQIFERSEDFAVRSVGLPDIGPLVGICFGKVVTLISPDTLSANWQEIVWHELVHVWTLQMTGNRMPRWVSEGVSTWEEREARPEWGRRQGMELVRAVREGKLLPVGSLNKGFSGASSNADLGFAYFQSYLVVDYIAKEFGFPKLLDLVKEYAHIREEDEMFRNVFGQSLEEFDAGFRLWIDQRVADINVYVHYEDAPDEGAGHGHGVRENSSAVLAELYNNASLKQHMRQRIQTEPRDFQAHLQLGVVLFKEQSYQDAEMHLQIAHELLPDYSGYPSPPLVLSQLYEKQGNRAGMLEQLKIMLGNQQHDYDSAMVLANVALERGDLEEAQYYIARALAVNPYKLDVHRSAAALALAGGNTADAVREHQILVNLDVNDPVEARTDLAQAYLSNGQSQEARRNILRALEVAPTYQRAQRVLLESIEADGSTERTDRQ
jgi:cellulose synthase operon protein C